MTAAPILTLEMLASLEQELRTRGPAVVEALRPGLTDSEMDERTAPLGLRLPHEARVWWGWRDGTDPQARARSFGPGILMSLDEAVERYRMERDLSIKLSQDDEEYGDPDHLWRPEWFPITAPGPCAACDCSVAPGETTPIRSIDYHGRDDHADIRARSFGEMVSWWLDALQAGAYRYVEATGTWALDAAAVSSNRLASQLL